MTPEPLRSDIEKAIAQILALNPDLIGAPSGPHPRRRPHRLQKVLIANRGEIAKRFFIALHEEGIPSVAVVTEADVGQSWYDFADEVIEIGDPANYINMPIIIAAALLSGADAIYPGYGFLSERHDFAGMIEASSAEFGRTIAFMGPKAEVMKRLGDKIEARRLAKQNNIPLFEGSDVIAGRDDALDWARRIGFPVIVKLSSSGGGRGVIIVNSEKDLADAIDSAQRIGMAHYRDDTFFIEQFVRDPIHMEVQIFNGWAIGVRKCAVQRNNQKIIEESGHEFLDDSTYLAMLADAERMARVSGYHEGCGAGTVEFLLDRDTGRYGFLEVNTRLQVEYAVTEESLGIDLVKWQILHFDGRGNEIPYADILRYRFTDRLHSIECRVNAEEPEQGYRPSPGRIQELILPTFNGVRCDFGFSGSDTVPPLYDAMIGKIIATGATRAEAVIRLERALQELYIKGLHTNVKQLIGIVRHPLFQSGDYTNRLLVDHPGLDGSTPAPGPDAARDFWHRSVVLFGALSEYIRLYHQKVREFHVIGSMDTSFKSRRLTAVPSRFRVWFLGGEHAVEVFQQTTASFYLFMDGEFSGRVELSSYSSRTDDFLFRMGSRSYRIRVQRRLTHLSIRMKDRDNKINYYRLRIEPEGMEEARDPAGLVRSPFQCSFVSLCAPRGARVAAGGRVEQGDPLIIVSSMKMETTITAPVAGTIEYLIDDGDESKLVQGATSAGQILGRGIQEGEILFLIAAEGEADARKPAAPSRDAVGVLSRLAITDRYIASPSRHLPRFLGIIRSYLQGFIQIEDITDDIRRTLDGLPDRDPGSFLTPEAEGIINDIVRFYRRIRQLFSPVIAGETSFFDELNYYFANIDNHAYRPPQPFRRLIDAVLESYRIERFKTPVESDVNALHQAFLHIQRAHYICFENRWIITGLLSLLSRSRNRLDETYDTLNVLMHHEQSELDDTLAKQTKNLMASMFPPEERDALTAKRQDEAMALTEFSLPALDRYRDEAVDHFMTSLLRQDTALLPEGVPAWVAEELSGKLERLRRDADIFRLDSPVPDAFAYHVHPRDGARHFLIFSYLAPGAAAPGGAGEDRELITRGLEHVLSNTMKIMALYHGIERSADNRIEILATGRPFARDPETNCLGEDYFRDMQRVCELGTMAPWSAAVRTIIIHARIDDCPFILSLTRAGAGHPQAGELRLDILLPDDPRNPYRDRTADPHDERMYDLGKWPADEWALRCLDTGSAEEIPIPGIDDVPSGKGGAPHRVASRIIRGLINGAEAVFYLKDFRVRGGATGDLEGLKYLAAAFLALARGCPLFVWNDSAGANINEGVISLNRGAQGFMVNALMGGETDTGTFERYIRHHPDRRLPEIFDAVTSRYGLPGAPRGNISSYLVAVGVGPSAGLDVYGASQTAVQILLDSEQAFRVLTGSNVVRSAVGETVSNYDIGGARVMGQWAGVVDIVAGDRFSLIAAVRKVRGVFAAEEDLPSIRRVPAPAQARDDASGPGSVFTEQLVRDNVDAGSFIPFKDGYHASRELVGGFARLGGRKVLVMGPRNSWGVRSFASATKAKDLLRTARKTGAHRILVMGGRWHQPADYHEAESIRARIDFLTRLSGGGVTVVIVTRADGLQNTEITSQADAVIAVCAGNAVRAERDFARKNAAFIAASLPGAFDLAHRVITMLDPIDATPADAGGAPSIPPDPAAPYDIVPSVIEKIFDRGSFMEWYGDMNDPSAGPNLVTGMARLGGRTVGVIADQPLIMGGGADSPGTQKFRVFTALLNRHRIPVVMLCNSSGFVPGIKQERLRIQAVGAESLDENILGKIPAVSMVLHQNYGGRQIQAFNRHLRPGIVALALERSLMAVIGANVAFEILQKRRYDELLAAGNAAEAEGFRARFMEEFTEKSRAVNDALAAGAVDWTVPHIGDLREHIIRALALAEERCREAFGE